MSRLAVLDFFKAATIFKLSENQIWPERKIVIPRRLQLSGKRCKSLVHGIS